VRVIYLFALRLAQIEFRKGIETVCYTTLCTGPPPVLDGFVCRARLVGDSAWEINCRRGGERIYAGTAD